jgi:hypothetical protein
MGKIIPFGAATRTMTIGALLLARLDLRLAHCANGIAAVNLKLL